ncbi:MAG: EVE domain-containing protein [Bacteroidales bacterium]|jgi:predicted RNA-binding protein with PUA-like domain|nr:EVE domain-containing protein [Bacteroidales bacterium]NLM92890.1 EVE domain-containing protein [Bacteroidales bacterium]
MNYWLVKSEPGAYSWQRLVKDKKTMWDGVRNYQARNNLREMKQGDLVLFYHSVNEKQVMGICRVVKEHYPDPTTDDDRWVVVDVAPVEGLKKPVTLEEIKNDDRLENIALIKQSRLSVMPLPREAFDAIVELGNS